MQRKEDYCLVPKEGIKFGKYLGIVNEPRNERTKPLQCKMIRKQKLSLLIL